MNPFLKLLLHNFFKNYKINKHTKFMLLYKHGCEKRYTHCYKNITNLVGPYRTTQ